MSSDFDPTAAFAALRDRAPQPRFAPAADVRRRGRRRTHRQLVVSAAAVVVLLVGAGALAAGPLTGGPTEPATTVSSRPPTSPAVTRVVPNELLLQPGDVPPGFVNGEDRDEPYPGGPPVAFACADLDFTWSARDHRRGERRLVYAGIDAVRQHLSLFEEQIRQQVTLYDAGWAARELADYRAWVDACPNPAGLTFRVLADDLGGDESVLYRIEPPGEKHYFLAIVRVGDRLTSVQIGGAFPEGTVRELAVRAGARLGA